MTTETKVEAVAWECRTQYSVWDDCTKEKYDHIIATGHYGGPASVKAEARALVPQSAITALEGEVERSVAYSAHLEEVVATRNLDWYTEKQRADAAERRVAELEAALRMARDELGGLPHSLGYEFTHLPKIDAALTKETP